MRTEEAPRFSQLMTVLGELYGKALTAALHDIYWGALSHYELSDVDKAIKKHVNHPDSGQFMPKPADLIRLLEGGTETRAKIAWSKVEKTLKSYGPYQTVVFDDPIIHLVLSDMGGWISLGSVTDEDWKFMGHDFEKRYRAYAINPTEHYPPKLIGISEQQNCSEGHHVPDPILIGDPEKAEKVLAHSSLGELIQQPMQSFQRLMLKVISTPVYSKTQ